MNTRYNISEFLELTCNSPQVADLPGLIEKEIDTDDFQLYYKLAFDLFLLEDLRWVQLDNYISSSMNEIDRKFKELERSKEYIESDLEGQKDLVFEKLLEMEPFFYNNDQTDKKLVIFDDVYLSLRTNPDMILSPLIELRKHLSFDQISLLMLRIEHQDYLFKINIDPDVKDGPIEDLVSRNILIQGENIPEEKRVNINGKLQEYFLINLNHELFSNKDLQKLVNSFNFCLLYVETLGNGIVRTLG